MPADAARRTLEAVEGAQRDAFAPMPFPWWYWIGLTLGLGAALAVGEIGNPVVGLVVTLGFVVFTLAGAVKLKNRDGRWVDTALMPRRLMLASILPLALTFLLLVGIVGFVVVAAWPDLPWLVLAALGMVGMIVGGPVCDRIYRRAYARWLAELSP